MKPVSYCWPWAIISQAKVLILDEPWDGLDTQACSDFNKLLQELSSQTTLILVLNRLSEVPVFCRQLVLMGHGSVQWKTCIDYDLEVQLAHLGQLQHMQQSELELPKRDTESFAPLHLILMLLW